MQILNDSLSTDNFSFHYPFLNKHIIENADFVPSRYGDTREVLDFKMSTTNPYKRCVGNNGRDINIFFLLAEAMWIFRGEKDVKFLEIFNSKMKTFSDDGKVFHAPYGFRLRHFGMSSGDSIENTITEENQHAIEQDQLERDQVRKAILMLKKNPADRRVVMQIWNAELDLGTDSKDIPCNDLVMLKVRDEKLITTIANRSNDLHWGLTTNLFQFSFISEVIGKILGYKMGKQTHNSQSLHVYLDNPSTFDMYDNIQITAGKFTDLYDKAVPFEMDFNFNSTDPELRLREIDEIFGMVIEACRKGERLGEENIAKLQSFSNLFYLVYELLFIYIDYKFNSERGEFDKLESLSKVVNLSQAYPKLDILALAQNFFYSKLKSPETLGKSINSLIHTDKL